MLSQLYELQKKVDFMNQNLLGIEVEKCLEGCDDYESLKSIDKIKIFNLIKKIGNSSIKYVA